MASPFDILSPEARAHLRAADRPAMTAPMLATLAAQAVPGQGWIYERKLDGQRCLGFCDGSEAHVRSRNGRSLDGTYPEVAEALAAAARGECIVDGEVVSFDGDVTSFSRLQGRMQISDPEAARETGIDVHYYLFDLLYLDGKDTTRLTLLDRKRLLREAFDFDDPLRYSEHRDSDGERYLEEACRQGWEGLIAKEASSPYEHRRSRRWLKLKCMSSQELVIGGYTDPKGSRIGFGALLLGYYEDDRLVYAGRVGTGFDAPTLRDLIRRLEARERRTSPFDDEADGRNVHWVSPELVAQIGFSEWTHDGRLRHPRYQGLRDDKTAREVHRELPRA